MQRRSFIALSVASAAASSTLAGPAEALKKLSTENAQHGHQFQKPEIARVIQEHESGSLVNPNSLVSKLQDSAVIDQARLSITPLECVSSRLKSNSSVDIELFYPEAKTGSSDQYSTLWSAHHHGIGAFPAGITLDSPTTKRQKVQLRVSQRTGDEASDSTVQSTILEIDATHEGSYILAIPTSQNTNTPIWRSCKVELDHSSAPTHIVSMLSNRSAECIYLHVQLTQSTAHAQSSSNIEGFNHA